MWGNFFVLLLMFSAALAAPASLIACLLLRSSARFGGKSSKYLSLLPQT